MADPKFDPANFRQILHSGYTLIRSIETNKAISSLTLDHLIQGHIDSLKADSVRASQNVSDSGKSLGNRISKWDRVDEIEKLFTKAVEALKDAGDNDAKLAALGIENVKGDFAATGDGTSTA